MSLWDDEDEDDREGSILVWIAVAIMALVVVAAMCGRPEPKAQAQEEVSKFAMKCEVVQKIYGNFIHRCANQERVCYTYSSNGIDCF